MKKIPILITALLALAWGNSCDKLSAPYASVKKDTTDTATIVRRVLLEDYTGHTCTNCPEAAILAHALDSASHGKLIVIAVHAGYFAEPASSGDFTTDYTCSTGNDWYSYFEVPSNPKGMVNRVPYEGTLVIGPDEWGNALQAQLALPQEANITIVNSYDSATGILHTSVESKFMAQLDGAYTLTVCVTEDSLVSPQKNNNPSVGPTPIIYDYVFMDVLRGSVNGSWGEEITAAVDTSEVISRSYNFTMDPAWVAEHCHVVAFISNETTRNVIQAAKEPLVSDVEP
jgi:hypothetical protein